MIKREICIESTGCFSCIFYESHEKCRLQNGPDWKAVYIAWRNGGFAIGCPMKEKAEEP